jgi:hypothetical protein
MATKTYSKTITDTQVMVKGIKDNQEVLSQRKIDDKFADNLQADVDTCIALNNEQETLKAKLKAKTEELDAAIASMNKKSSEARKIIKLDMPQSTWREFGIEDKR